MSSIVPLSPPGTVRMRLSVEPGPTLVVKFDDNWSYPLKMSPSEAVYIAALLLGAAIDGSTEDGPT